MNKKLLIILSIIVAGGIFFAVSRNTHAPENTATVKKGPVIETVKQSGNLRATAQTAIYAQTTGIIQEIYVKNGQEVKAGEKIVRIKSTATQKEQSAAYASILSAQTNVDAAKQSKLVLQSNLEAARKSILDAVSAQKTMNDNVSASKNNPSTGKSYTQNEIDSINSALESARLSFTAAEKKYLDADTTINSAKATLKAAQDAYNATRDSDVLAPTDGIIANIDVREKDNTTGTSPTAPGSQIATLVSYTGYVIEVDTNELAINKIMNGQNVAIQFDAIPRKTYNGVVSRVDDVGKIVQGLVSYTVEIQLSNADNNTKPGMTATVLIETAKKENAVYIPSSAIQKQGEKNIVTVKTGNTTRQVPVTTGLSGGGKTEITDGVKEGDQVIIDTKQ